MKKRNIVKNIYFSLNLIIIFLNIIFLYNIIFYYNQNCFISFLTTNKLNEFVSLYNRKKISKFKLYSHTLNLGLKNNIKIPNASKNDYLKNKNIIIIEGREKMYPDYSTFIYSKSSYLYKDFYNNYRYKAINFTKGGNIIYFIEKRPIIVKDNPFVKVINLNLLKILYILIPITIISFMIITFEKTKGEKYLLINLFITFFYIYFLFSEQIY